MGFFIAPYCVLIPGLVDLCSNSFLGTQQMLLHEKHVITLFEKILHYQCFSFSIWGLSSVYKHCVYLIFIFCQQFGSRSIFLQIYKIILTLNVPIPTKVVCFSHLLKCLRSLYGKQCEPRSDCSYRAVCSGSMLFASILNLSVMLEHYLQQTSADNIFRCIFFLGALRVNYDQEKGGGKISAVPLPNMSLHRSR